MLSVSREGNAGAISAQVQYMQFGLCRQAPMDTSMAQGRIWLCIACTLSTTEQQTNKYINNAVHRFRTYISTVARTA